MGDIRLGGQGRVIYYNVVPLVALVGCDVLCYADIAEKITKSKDWNTTLLFHLL